MLFYSWTGYSAALRVFWEMQGHTLAFSEKEVQFITDRDVKKAREENPAQALLFPLGLPSASFSSFSITCFESVYMASELIQESTFVYMTLLFAWFRRQLG